MKKVKRAVVNQTLMRDFCRWMEMLGYQETTVYGMQKNLYYLLIYLEDNGLEISSEALQQYTQYVKQRPKMSGQKGLLSASSIYNIYQTIRLLQEYFSYMKDVFLDVYLPPMKRQAVERKTLSIKQINLVYQVIEQEKNEALRLRDKALMAVLYGAGLRRGEAQRLQIKHLLFRQKRLYVLPGKTGVQRYVPMTETMIKDLKTYIYEGRYAAKPKAQHHVFISRRGNALSKPMYQERLKIWEARADFITPLTPHLLRHSIATHLLKAGMSIEKISQFLGHRSLAATQIYTHIT